MEVGEEGFTTGTGFSLHGNQAQFFPAFAVACGEYGLSAQPKQASSPVSKQTYSM